MSTMFSLCPLPAKELKQEPFTLDGTAQECPTVLILGKKLEKKRLGRKVGLTRMSIDDFSLKG